MPGLACSRRNDQSLSNNNNGSSSCYSSCKGFWSKHRDDVSFNQLQKFWSELPPQARQSLLRIEKQILFEQARKNMYCSRCNGLLLEGFMQIVMYGKSLQHDVAGAQAPDNTLGISKDQRHGGPSSTSVCQDETQDPSVHPWGGLTTTRDGALTLLDCYLYSKSLKGLQNVFDSARARERERELLYPDACGGGGRGWISQGIASYGRGHGTRETCALHTARLSCDTLVDFWSALGEETRQSLLRMKEEDFIERLMYRFDSKRFCRDCRRNVIREFKELKELKRMRREPRCTSWFCVADTTFQYEVSNDTIHADWHQTFFDSIGKYHHFEWAVGSGEGKDDILEFENVGMNGSVQVNGLDLGGLNACYITLRACKPGGGYTEFTVKAHALKGRECVHCRLAVGNGYVTITRGESIRRFFEHAEEAEEEEDDDSMDKDGNDLDGECSRPQKHAKSPELAREFLLDAATVIFKEQVEKAFREGTARQNAHSIFVCLALKLLEERIHVACKEIITLEKQMKLLEEEEKEKREEEERKERKRTKEREKKLRRKERLRGKDKGRKCIESNQTPISIEGPEEVSSPCLEEESNSSIRDSVSETGDGNMSESGSPEVLDESSSNDYTASDFLNNAFDCTDGELADIKEGSGLFPLDSLKGPRRKLKVQRDLQLESSLNWSDRRRSTENGAVAYKSESRYYDDSSEDLSKGVNCLSRQPRANTTKFNTRNNGPRFSQKVQGSSIRMTDKNDLHSCGCDQQNDLRAKVEPQSSITRFNRDSRPVTKLESSCDMPKSVHRINKFNQADCVNMRDNCGRPRNKILTFGNAFGRDTPHTKKVWEPVEPQKRYPRSNSDSDVTLRSCSFKAGVESDKSAAEICFGEISEKISGVSLMEKTSRQFSCQNDFQSEAADEEVDVDLTRSCNLNGTSDFSASSSSSSDNCSSCLSEGDSNTPSSNHPNMESSSTSDSEDSSQQSEGRESSVCVQNGLSETHDVRKERNRNIDGEEPIGMTQSSSFSSQNFGNHHMPWNSPTKTSSLNAENGKTAANGVASIQQSALPSMHNPNVSFPLYQGPSAAGFYHQNPIPWSTTPANGFVAYPHPNYLFASPFGYGISGESPFCMQYPVQHLASPLINNNQFPIYPQAPRSNCLNPHDQTLKVSGVRDPSGVSRRENVVSTQCHDPIEAPPKGGVEKGNLTKPDAGNTGFSLFQFNSPVALSSYRTNFQPQGEGKGGDISCCRIEGDQACSKKETTIEEYNLFAASNGIQFSIF